VGLVILRALHKIHSRPLRYLLSLDCSLRRRSLPRNSTDRRHLKGVTMRRLKTLLSATSLFSALALAPIANAQVAINLGVPPVCSYGYYDYAPYSCSPMGFYGPGYFYNGIFLGMGPWAGWGYSHGWGSHRFSNGGGGRYTGGGGYAANHAGPAGGRVVHASNARAVHNSGNRGAHATSTVATSSHAPAVHTSVSHSARPKAATVSAPSHQTRAAAAPHGGGGDAHGGGEHRK